MNLIEKEKDLKGSALISHNNLKLKTLENNLVLQHILKDTETKSIEKIKAQRKLK